MKEFVLSFCALAFIKSCVDILLENSGFKDIADLCIGIAACIKVISCVKELLR